MHVRTSITFTTLAVWSIQEIAILQLVCKTKIRTNLPSSSMQNEQWMQEVSNNKTGGFKMQ